MVLWSSLLRMDRLRAEGLKLRASTEITHCAMSSLADELAADLDFSDEQSVHSDDDRQNEQSQDQDAMDINEDGEATKDTDRSTNDASPSSGHQDNVHKVTKFLQSKQTKDILEVSKGNR